ncbi:MAG TPA: gliding motility-associated C-terminal domain-containing protein [Bacteroidia bacterium]|nr:gliding motility-associated C-terminal domain-containing protein [Bacteroidia bacterium]
MFKWSNVLPAGIMCALALFAKADAPRHTVPFVQNKGQWPKQILYKSALSSGAIYLEKNGWVYSFYDDAPLKEYIQKWHSKDFNRNYEGHQFSMKGHSFRVSFTGGRNDAEIVPEQKQHYYYNFFQGSKQEQWATEAGAYSSVVYKNAYEHTDVRIQKLNMGVKYDILLHPRAQINVVKLRFTGADSLWLSEGKLYIKTSVNTVVEQRPYAYQRIKNAEVQVPCHFVLDKNELSFSIDGDYNKNETLVIDPLLIFSTYSGSTADNFGHTATYDSKGHLYAGGITTGAMSGGYPTDTGSFQQTYGGGTGFFPCDITISKYSTNGDSLLFATYLGGQGNDYPHSLVCDNNDNLVVMGTTYSRNFPTTPSAYDTSYNASSDIIVSKFSIDGKQLLGSTFVGGAGVDGLNNSSTLQFNYADDYRGDIIFDQQNNYYVAGCTTSPNFPTTNRAPQKISGGGQDGIAFKLNADLTQLLWSTYCGGSGDDALYSVRLNRNEELFMGGGSNSSNFPTTVGVLQPNFQGGRSDGIILHMNNTGDTVFNSSYVGTAGYDQVYFIDLDRSDRVYITGQTDGTIPVFPASVYNMPNSGQFLFRMNKQFSAVNLSTTFGTGLGGPDLSPSAFLVDNCDNIYFSGWGGSINTGNNTSLLPITPDAYQKTSDGEDFYIVVFNRDADSILYATYFGGNQSGDHVDGGTSRFDKRGIIYQSVCSSCPAANSPPISDFPVTPGAVFTSNLSPRCSNASFKFDLQLSDFIQADFTPQPNIGCAPLAVNMNNKSIGGVLHIWNYGDGSPLDTNSNPTHIFNAGIFKVKLFLIDSGSCNVIDSIEKTITALPSAKAEFTYSYNLCSDEITLTNTSENVLKLKWDFDDGNTDTINFSPTHVYEQPGEYTVKLIINPGLPCADSTEQKIELSDSTQQFFVPNVITPNQDDKNEGWYVAGLDPACDQVHVRIYNRWGQLMFETKDVTEKWYGTNERNFESPAGEYFYIVEIKRKTGYHKTHTGHITLIRESRE